MVIVSRGKVDARRAIRTLEACGIKFRTVRLENGDYRIEIL